MSPIWFTPFIIVAGALQAFGALMSAQLRVSLTNPWLALTVLFTLNAFFFAGLALIDKIGAGPVNGLIITANLLTSLAIDHFGLMNMPVAIHTASSALA